MAFSPDQRALFEETISCMELARGSADTSRLKVSATPIDEGADLIQVKRPGRKSRQIIVRAGMNVEEIHF